MRPRRMRAHRHPLIQGTTVVRSRLPYEWMVSSTELASTKELSLPSSRRGGIAGRCRTTLTSEAGAVGRLIVVDQGRQSDVRNRRFWPVITCSLQSRIAI